MKYTKILFALYALCVGAALTTSTASAQIPTAYKPGDLLTFIVVFDGPGTDQIGAINVEMHLTTPQHNDQPSFSTGFAASKIKPLGGGKFEVSTIIHEYVASGTYAFNRVTAGPAELGGIWDYPHAEGAPPITIIVDNDKHFAKPTLKSVEKTSKP